MPISLLPKRSGHWKLWHSLSTRILAIVLLCPPAMALNPDWHIYQYGHRAWKIGDAFPGAAVNAITQDTDGYLWIGTYTGLFRFDGVRFTQWNPPHGTRSPGGIVSLLADRDGSLWMSTTEGLKHWDHQHLTPYDVGDQLTFVPSMLQDMDGAVWFSPSEPSNMSDALLCEISHSKLSCHGHKSAIPSLSPPTALALDSSGTMWVGESRSLIGWRNGSLSIFPLPALRNNASQEGIHALAADPDGSLLVGMTKRGPGLGLQRFRNGRSTVVSTPGFDGSRHRITKLLVDGHHALWIGTTDEGLYRLYQGRVDHFDSHSGLSGDSVLALHEDREGSLWVGTSEGIDQFRDLAVQAFSRTVYPRGEEFDNLVTTPDGTLWVGGDSTLYTLGNGATEFIPRAKGLEGKQVTTIYGDRAHRIWIGVDNNLNLFRNGKLTPVKMVDGGPTGFIVSMAEEADGTLWALTTGPPRRILCIDPHALRATPGPPVDASKIVGDPHGGLWIGSNKGDLLHDLKGTVTPVAFAHDSGARVSQLSVTPDGALLAAGQFGLAYMHDQVAQVLATPNGLPCANVNNFVFDAEGNLWLYAQCGLIRINWPDFTRWLSDPTALLNPRTFDTSDGFRTFLPPFEGSARSPDGRLWFNNLQALQVVDPANLHRNTVVPPVHIESFRADFRDYALTQMVQLPRFTRNIEIDYSALSFVAPEKVDFRYRLSGFDPEWHDVGTRRQAIYTNLKPGSYRFQVIASNNDDVWNSEGGTVEFTIPPMFYQTNWFLACAALVLLALINVVFVVRLRISTRLVEGRMNERLMERDRIARELHDTFLQGFQGIVLRLHGIAKTLSESSSPRLALEDTMDRADQILTEGRENLLQLRSSAEDAPQLADRINRTIADLQVQKFISCELRVQGSVRVLKPTVDEEIFAMAREALTNAFRHSDATTILAELHFASTHFSFRCTDNGAGFPAVVLKEGSAEGHWGLIGLRERAEKLHARLVLGNNEPHGALVEIVLRARLAYVR